MPEEVARLVGDLPPSDAPSPIDRVSARLRQVASGVKSIELTTGTVNKRLKEVETGVDNIEDKVVNVDDRLESVEKDTSLALEAICELHELVQTIATEMGIEAPDPWEPSDQGSQDPSDRP